MLDAMFALYLTSLSQLYVRVFRIQ